MGGGTTEAPDVGEAARQEGYDARLAAQQETLANRPNQYGPKWNVEWERTAYDPNTGLPYDESTPNVGWDHDNNRPLGGYIDPGNRYYSWEQNTSLSDPFQQQLDQQLASAEQAQFYRDQQAYNWAVAPTDYTTSGVQGTIGTGDLAQFGQNSPNMGAQDWRQFGTTSPTTGANDWRQFGTSDPTLGADDWREFGYSTPTTGAQDWRQFGTTGPTIGADQWQNLGYTDNTIGADDWRQFGNTERTVNSGDYDARYGGENYRDEYGDHDMSGGDWSLIQYEPEHIRRQAEQQTLDFMNSQLDPQWDTRMQDLEIKLANQGLQWGDAAYDNAMAAQKRARDNAYGGARNQALADSRAEAMMLWDQEMGMSEQKNKYLQQDMDNAYRARQSNISNYLQGQGQDQQAYLNYQQAAFDQDRLARQQQLDANLGYGRESYQQDLQAREQALNAQLGYGRESYQQDFQSRQQQLDANRLYNQQAWEQDYGARQQALDANRMYGEAAFGQDYQSRQQQLDANRLYGDQAYQQDYSSRQQQLDANRMYSQQAFDQDLAARQANIGNYLNYGNAQFDQGMQNEQLSFAQRQAAERDAQARYGLVNPGDNAANIEGILAE